MPFRRASATKNVVLGLVAVAILAAAGVVALKTGGAGSNESTHLASLEKSRDYQSRISRKFGADEEKRFGSVTITAGPLEYDPKNPVKLEISGRVSTQQALDELKKLIADNPAPVEVVWTVTLVPNK